MLSLGTFADPELVAEALSLGRGATVRHGVDVLDMTDTPTEDSLTFTSWQVDWNYRPPDRVAGQSDGVAAVRRQGSIDLVGDVTINLYGVRLRLWTEFRCADGTWARFTMGVFEVVTPGAVVDDGTTVRRTLSLAGKSHRWANTYLDDPLVVPAGTVIVDYVKASLLSVFGESRYAIATSAATLGQEMVLEPGLSWLEVYSRLLAAAGMDQLTDSRDGLPASQSLEALAGKGVEHTYGAGQGKVLTAGQVEPLLPTLPNVVRFSARQGPSLGNVEGNGLVTVTNQSTGPASIDARGAEVVLVVDVDADDQATLEQIATADAQRYFAGGGLRWQGQVGLNPRHDDRDVIGLELPRMDLTGGAWLVTSWTYTAGSLADPSHALMPITAERRVS